MNSTLDSSLLESDVKGRSLWSDAFRRFRQNRGAMIGPGVVLFVVLAAEAGYVEALEMALGFEEQASKFYVDVAERS